jgi:hypothetical protein
MKVKAIDIKFGNTKSFLKIEKQYIKLPSGRKIINSCERFKNEEGVFNYIYLINKEYKVCLNFFQHSYLLFWLKQNWFQKEENIRYIVNILFLILGVYISYKK